MLINRSWAKNFPFLYRIPNYKIDSDIIAIEAGYNRVPPGKCQIFRRNVFILHYISNGKGIFLNRDFDAANGYFVAPNEFEIIKSDTESPFESYWIMLEGDGAAGLLKKINLTHNCIFTIEQKEDCIACIKDVLFNENYSNDAEEAYALQAALYKILSIHMKNIEIEATNVTSVAAIVANTIKKNYNTPIKINDLAHDFNISRNYLYTLFKKTYGVSPQEYLLMRRIEKAKQLLSNNTTDLSVKQISIAVGFENPLYFSRVFRARTGFSPTQYRKNEKQL